MRYVHSRLGMFMKKIFTALAATKCAFMLSLVIGAPARAAMPAVSNPLYGTISRSCNTTPTVWYSND